MQVICNRDFKWQVRIYAFKFLVGISSKRINLTFSMCTCCANTEHPISSLTLSLQMRVHLLDSSVVRLCYYCWFTTTSEQREWRMWKLKLGDRARSWYFSVGYTRRPGAVLIRSYSYVSFHSSSRVSLIVITNSPIIVQTLPLVAIYLLIISLYLFDGNVIVKNFKQHKYYI